MTPHQQLNIRTHTQLRSAFTLSRALPQNVPTIFALHAQIVLPVLASVTALFCGTGDAPCNMGNLPSCGI